MPAQSTKPDRIQPVGGTIEDTDFDTGAQRAAAEDIMEHYPDTHNLSEIARRSGWTKSHISKVFNQYFEAAEEETETVDVGDEEREVLADLKDFNVAESSPLDALSKISEWQERLDE